MSKPRHSQTTVAVSLSAVVLITVCVLSIAIQLTSALYVLLLPQTNAIAFVPAAIHYNTSGELANPAYPLAYATDPTGEAIEGARSRLVFVQYLVVIFAASVFLIAQAGMRLPTVGRPESLGELFVLGTVL